MTLSPRQVRFLKLLLLGLAFLAGSNHVCRAADPQPYNVIFKPSGDPKLDLLLRQSSTLEQLREKSPVGPFALIGRAEADRRNFVTVLESEGYDSGAVAITIDGYSLDNASLPQTLQRAPAAPPVPVVVTVDRGPLYHIGEISVAGLRAAIANRALGITTGEPAKATPILDAAMNLQDALRDRGFAFAKVAEPVAYADPANHTLSLRYSVALGPRVDIGAIKFSGLQHAKAAFLYQQIAIRPGQLYSAAELDRARSGLLALGLFSSVSLKTAKLPTPQGQLPVTFVVHERKLHQVAISAAYSSDLGVSSNVSWMDRNVFGEGQRLTLSLGSNQLGSAGGKKIKLAPGYDVTTTYQIPDFWERGQSFMWQLQALREYLPAYNRTGVLADVGLSRPLANNLTANFGLSFTSERVEQENIDRRYVINQEPINLDYDTTNSLLNPTHGTHLTLRVVPSIKWGQKADLFVTTELIGDTYINMEAPGRGVLALRAVLGRIFGASQFGVPPDQRFYAGGTGTVRGFTYQTVGPQFSNGIPEGGTSIDAFEIEFRQRLGKHLGIAPFLDAGQVSASGAIFAGKLRVGTGLGFLYYTSIGPIRLDIGVPVNRPPGGASFAIYIGLGQAF